MRPTAGTFDDAATILTPYVDVAYSAFKDYGKFDVTVKTLF